MCSTNHLLWISNFFNITNINCSEHLIGKNLWAHFILGLQNIFLEMELLCQKLGRF